MKNHLEGILWSVSIGALFLGGFISSHALVIAFGVAWLVQHDRHSAAFYRAWKKWGYVTNRREYAAWVGFETAAVLALIVLGTYTVISK